MIQASTRCFSALTRYKHINHAKIFVTIYFECSPLTIPKPSLAPTALLKPIPMANTNGTVTGPVVTPARNHNQQKRWLGVGW
jgi:hypothetical protein